MCCFGSPGLLLQLKGGDICKFKTSWLCTRIACSISQRNTKLSVAKGDQSLSAAAFLSQLMCILPHGVAQAPLLSCQDSQRSASMWKTSVGCCGGFRVCVSPSLSTAKGSRTQEQPKHGCSSRYQRMICVWKLLLTAIQHWQFLENFWT